MGYRHTVLPNGVTVVSEDSDSFESISLGFWFFVGSRDEAEAEAGMSHFMEHMLFKGTATRSAMDISSQFEGLGAELNAFTTQEYTCFYASFVADKLDQCFEILADMVNGSVFDSHEIESEREVVLEEIARGEGTPEDYIYDVFIDSLFPSHTLGRPIIGTRDTVKGFSHDDCVAYHSAHYRSRNLVVCAAGAIDHDKLVELSRRYFSELGSCPRSVRPAFGSDANRPTAFVHKDTEQAHILYGMPTFSAFSKERFAAILLDSALGGGMSSRLFQEVREKRGLVYSIYAQSQFFTDAGQFYVYAGTRPSNIEQVVALIKDEVGKAAADGISQEELDRARNYVIGQVVMGMEASRSRMSRIGRMAITNREYLSLPDVLDLYRSVTVEDVKRVAQEVYTRKPTLAIISPMEVSDLEMLFG